VSRKNGETMHRIRLYSRRDFIRISMAAVPASVPMLPKIDSVFNGVRLGSTTYSFRDLPRTPGSSDAVDVMIKALTECGVGETELSSPFLEPLPPEEGPYSQRAYDELTRWRFSTSLDYFRAVRKKFQDAGISVFSYAVDFRSDLSDKELEKLFEQAKALGVGVISSSVQISVLGRVVPLAEKYKVSIALHGHSNVQDTDQFSSPESFSKALKMSKYFKVNLDIGHFAAANFNSVEYIREIHDRITHLHVKDRKKNQGPNVPWGEGDTPIKQVLVLLKENKYPIRALVEYEHGGQGTPIEEVKKCMTYMRQALV
jgi:sugar phosphate isomerase/epimerase